MYQFDSHEMDGKLVTTVNTCFGRLTSLIKLFTTARYDKIALPSCPD